jgi:uncharacterized protein YjbI with pentapeptide repeats
MGNKYVEGFFQSEIPARDSNMNATLIRSLAEGNEAFTKEEIEKLIHEHTSFINSGGGGGRFERLQVAGMPMNMYTGKGSAGKQFEVRMKKFAADTDLSGVTITYGDFSGSLAEEIIFENATLDYSLMTDSFLAGSNFDKVSARGVDFTGADLTGASFVNADLRNADFEICNCTGVDFTGANIEGALFKGTNLDGIRR